MNVNLKTYQQQKIFTYQWQKEGSDNAMEKFSWLYSC